MACNEWIHVGYTGRKISWTEKVQFHTMQWDSLHIIEPKPGWLQLSSTPQEQAFDLSWVTASMRHALSFQVRRPYGKSNSYVAKIMVVMFPPSF